MCQCLTHWIYQSLVQNIRCPAWLLPRHRLYLFFRCLPKTLLNTLSITIVQIKAYNMGVWGHTTFCSCIVQSSRDFFSCVISPVDNNYGIRVIMAVRGPRGRINNVKWRSPPDVISVIVIIWKIICSEVGLSENVFVISIIISTSNTSISIFTKNSLLEHI